ncbi:SH3 domain-containing protein [Sphingobacterium chuzhouense]|uniref:SH3 domain-containing protein n=1 Tax=Sphingobacterium chuzhouense TaxID=1742264 RepID=A0ABR7XRA3_9SPHI|nr:SH3 domain-containing protein [Sphingobacterium chuzhouense]MBD1421705.1 SH3 domain-containing protein [Sphingobacterium chuzhouense]
MALFDKYKALLDEAGNLITEDLQFMEQNGVLIIRGVTPNAEAKNKLWDIYSQIDPNFISGEVLLDVDVLSTVKGCKARLFMEDPILNVHKGPGVELPTIGNVKKGEIVTVISRANVYWWLVRIHNIEGYCYAENIEQV